MGCPQWEGVHWGEWSLSEQEYHINYLELLALFFALKSFCSLVRNQHVRVFTDNSTAMVYVNKMGGTRSPPCNQLTKYIWSWCQERNIWISAGFVPGKDNSCRPQAVADHRSRNFKNERTEWMLDKNLFAEIIKVFGTPDIDLFSSRDSYQIMSLGTQTQMLNMLMLFHWTGVISIFMLSLLSILIWFNGKSAHMGHFSAKIVVGKMQC